MRKVLIICLAFLFSALPMVVARTLYIEKALRVKVDGQKTELKAGVSLDEETKVTIPEDGVLVMLDRSTGKRWLVKKKYSGKLGKLAKDKEKNLWTTSKSLFYSYSQPKEKKKKKSAGAALVGGPSGMGLGTVIGSTNQNVWDGDTTYNFLNEITSDSVSYILVE